VKNGHQTPAVILSRQAEVEAWLTCLNMVTDNYLTEPVQSKEPIDHRGALVRGPSGHCKNVPDFSDFV
tara:strand:+ start:256 stop:459 length:204 start_codon:yes stop_codon:yes gene_type:complete